MTPQEVERRVKALGSLVRDGEAFHVAEDELYSDVLRAIANGNCEDPALCAGFALGSQDIVGGRRWCA